MAILSLSVKSDLFDKISELRRNKGYKTETKVIIKIIEYYFNRSFLLDDIMYFTDKYNDILTPEAKRDLAIMRRRISRGIPKSI